MGDQDRRIMEWVGRFLQEQTLVQHQEQALVQLQEEEKDPVPQVPPPQVVVHRVAPPQVTVRRVGVRATLFPPQAVVPQTKLVVTVDLFKYKCSVCLDVVKQPVQLIPCGHIFCRACIDSVRSISQKKTCPECRSVCSFFPDAFHLRELKNEVIVCEWCDKNVLFGTIEYHYEKECEKVVVKCALCGENENPATHKCAQETVSCDECKLRFQRCDFDKHKKYHQPMECAICGQKVPPTEFSAHYSTHVSKTVIKSKPEITYNIAKRQKKV